MNSYYIRARFFPALLTSLPILVLLNVFLLNSTSRLFFLSNSLQILINTGISGALIFLLVQINRLVSKEIFQRWFFQNELNMPTVDYILVSNSFFESSIKKVIRDKINDKYKIQLLSAEEEQADEFKARQLIVSITAQMRNDLRENKMLLQHNIEYGFIRNLIGGSFVAFVFSIFLLVYGAANSDAPLQLTGIIMCLVYLFPLLMSKSLIRKYGHYYAKIFFDQFLSL